MSASKRIQVELKRAQNPAYTIELINDEINNWKVSVPGPAGSLFEGVKVKFQIFYGPEYPHKAPEVIFNPPIYHPNVDEKGLTCPDCVGTEPWSATKKTTDIIPAVIKILKEPNPASVLNVEAAALYTSNVAEYNKNVKKFLATYK